jgi:hypothetical protein
MRYTLFALAFVLTFSSFFSNAQEKGKRNGQAIEVDDSLLIWHVGSETWMSVEDFWMMYADENGGLKWGQRESYPPYEQVQELDKIIIRLAQGECLMEFFHERWRRANDVRRWDPKLNEHGGCPHVF